MLAGGVALIPDLSVRVRVPGERLARLAGAQLVPRSHGGGRRGGRDCDPQREPHPRWAGGALRAFRRHGRRSRASGASRRSARRPSPSAATRACARAFNARDWEALGDCYADDIEMSRPALARRGRRCTGASAVGGDVRARGSRRSPTSRCDSRRSPATTSTSRRASAATATPPTAAATMEYVAGRCHDRCAAAGRAGRSCSKTMRPTRWRATTSCSQTERPRDALGISATPRELAETGTISAFEATRLGGGQSGRSRTDLEGAWTTAWSAGASSRAPTRTWSSSRVASHWRPTCRPRVELLGEPARARGSARNCDARSHGGGRRRVRDRDAQRSVLIRDGRRSRTSSSSMTPTSIAALHPLRGDRRGDRARARARSHLPAA